MVDKEEKAYLTKADSVTLPDFVDFPEPELPIYYLKDNGDFYYLEGTAWQFKLASEAYDYANNVLKGEVVFGDLRRAEGKKPSKKKNKRDGLVFEKHTNRLLVSFTKSDKLTLLKHTYASFLEQDKEYQKDPENWAKAYNWVQEHPAFYHRYKEGSNDWEFQSGWDSKWESVGIDEKGKPSILLEHGPFAEGARVISSHDIRLDTHASTFEDVYVEFAKKVNKFYDTRGESRPEYDWYGKRVTPKKDAKNETSTTS